MSMIEDMEGDYEDGEELLRFLQDNNPTLKLHRNDDTHGVTFYSGSDVVDGIQSGQWIHVHDPVRTVDCR